MSERIVDNPANHGWVEENGKWVWGASGGSIQDGDTEGQITTWGGTEWTPEGAVIVDANGNVDIGNTGMPQRLAVDGQASFKADGTNGGSFLISPTSESDTRGGVDFYVRNGGWQKELTVDSNGNVGIGTDSPAAKLDLGDSTGQKLLLWSSSGSTNNIKYGQAIETNEYRMFAEEQASITLGHMSRTDGATYTERMRIDSSGRVGIGGTPSRSTKEIEDEAESTLANWKSQLDERLKAEPKADKKAVTQEITGHDKMPTKAELVERLTERNIGGGNAKLQVAGDGYFSGTVNAGKFVGDGSGLTNISGGGGGLPDGGYTYGWTITATDFIATSDERLKEDISPLPVGLIDDIKPVQWSWKDGSGKSAGVIAQQLQAIGLDDFVNEDADGNLGVNYNALVGVLLAEVISLKAEVESLK